MKNILTILCFVVAGVLSISAQKVLDKGMVKMEITNISSEDPQMEAMLGGMKGSQTEVVFNKDNYVSTSDMMGGMIKVIVKVSHKDSVMNMLFDAMGNKTWVESKLDKAQSAQQKAIAEKNSVTYDKADTKEILGYKCYKMTVTNPELEGTTVSGYVCPDIKTDANIIQGFQSVKFEGYPMEFTVGSNQMAMTFTAKELSDKVDDSKFNLNTTGYTKMTMDEFQKKMAQMGMGGF